MYISAKTSLLFSINAPGISSGVNFTTSKFFSYVYTLLKFAGNLGALRPRFNAYSVSVNAGSHSRSPTSVSFSKKKARGSGDENGVASASP